MPIGYVTENQGESRYTVAIDADTALLQILIKEKEALRESVLQVLFGTGGSSGLYAQEREYVEAYDAAMQVVAELTNALNGERAEVTVESCLTARLQECADARSAARQACRDAAVSCRNGCDGSLDCLNACDDTEDACEDAAEIEWERCTSQARLDCVDFVTERNSEIFAYYSPLVADAQARTVEALAPLQACRKDIAQWEAQRLSVDQALRQLKEIETRGIPVTCWSAQYDDAIAVDAEVEVAQTPSGRHVITAIGSDDQCLHDARAVPAFNLFVSAALNPGVETWRPRWRTGIVRAVNEDGTLKVEVQGGEMHGTLGTRYSRRTINCTPPQAYFSEDGDINSTGEARQGYEDALQEWQDALAARDACYAEFDAAACLLPLYESCADGLDAARLDCLDVRALGVAACAGDPFCVAYVEEQYQACIEAAETALAACYQGSDDQCAINRKIHNEACDSTHTTLIRDAHQAMTEAETALRNAIAMTQSPASPLELDIRVEHCSPGNYSVGDDVLIDFPTRAASMPPSGATSEAIRAAAMAVWQSARVIGWASEPKACAAMMLNEVFLTKSQESWGVWAYGMPTGFRWDQAKAFYEHVIAGQVTFEAGMADAEGELTLAPLVLAYVDGGGEAFYTPLACDNGSISVTPGIWVSNPAPDEPEPVEACIDRVSADIETHRAMMKSADGGGVDGAWRIWGRDFLLGGLGYCNEIPAGQIMHGQFVYPNGDITYQDFEVRDASLSTLYLWAPDVSVVHGIIDQAVDARLSRVPGGCQSAYDELAPDWDLYNSQSIIEHNNALRYYGLGFIGDGYIDCEYQQPTQGGEYQTFRITDTADGKVWSFSLRYVGLGTELTPACGKVTEVRTSADVSPTVVVNCPGVSVVKGVLTPPQPPDPEPEP